MASEDSLVPPLLRDESKTIHTQKNGKKRTSIHSIHFLFCQIMGLRFMSAGFDKKNLYRPIMTIFRFFFVMIERKEHEQKEKR
jgi:hypothetical protein